MTRLSHQTGISHSCASCLEKVEPDAPAPTAIRLSNKSVPPGMERTRLDALERVILAHERRTAGLDSYAPQLECRRSQRSIRSPEVNLVIDDHVTRNCALIRYDHANFGPLTDRGPQRFHIDLLDRH